MPRAKQIPRPLQLAPPRPSNILIESEPVTPDWSEKAGSSEDSYFPTTLSWVAFAHDIGAWTSAHSDSPELQARLELYSKSTRRYLGLVAWSKAGQGTDEQDHGKDGILLYVSSDGAPCQVHHSMPLGGDKTLDGQEPLEATEKIPWNDVHQCTTWGARVIVRKVHGSEVDYTMADGEIRRFQKKIANDLQDLDDLTAKEIVDPDSKVPPYAVPVEVWRDVRVCGDTLPSPRCFVQETRELMQCVLEFLPLNADER